MQHVSLNSISTHSLLSPYWLWIVKGEHRADTLDSGRIIEQTLTMTGLYKLSWLDHPSYESLFVSLHHVLGGE